MSTVLLRPREGQNPLFIGTYNSTTPSVSCTYDTTSGVMNLFGSDGSVSANNPKIKLDGQSGTITTKTISGGTASFFNNYVKLTDDGSLKCLKFYGGVGKIGLYNNAPVVADSIPLLELSNTDQGGGTSAAGQIKLNNNGGGSSSINTILLDGGVGSASFLANYVKINNDSFGTNYLKFYSGKGSILIYNSSPTATETGVLTFIGCSGGETSNACGLIRLFNAGGGSSPSSTGTIELNGALGQITLGTIVASNNISVGNSSSSRYTYDSTSNTMTFYNTSNIPIITINGSSGNMSLYSPLPTSITITITNLSRGVTNISTTNRSCQYIFSCTPVSLFLTSPRTATISLISSGAASNVAFSPILDTNLLTGRYTYFFSQTSSPPSSTLFVSPYFANVGITEVPYSPINSSQTVSNTFTSNATITTQTNYSMTGYLSPTDSSGNPNYIMFVMMISNTSSSKVSITANTGTLSVSTTVSHNEGGKTSLYDTQDVNRILIDGSEGQIILYNSSNNPTISIDSNSGFISYPIALTRNATPFTIYYNNVPAKSLSSPSYWWCDMLQSPIYLPSGVYNVSATTNSITSIITGINFDVGYIPPSNTYKSGNFIAISLVATDTNTNIGVSSWVADPPSSGKTSTFIPLSSVSFPVPYTSGNNDMSIYLPLPTFNIRAPYNYIKLLIQVGAYNNNWTIGQSSGSSTIVPITNISIPGHGYYLNEYVQTYFVPQL